MEADFTIKQNDTGPSFQCRFVDEDGNVADIDAATITFRMVDLRDGTVKVNNAAGTVADVATATAEYTWAAADTDTAGYYHADMLAVKGSVRLSSPNDGHYLIQVVPKLT